MAITEPKLKKTELANHISALSGTFRKPKESEINALKEELENLKNKTVVFAAEYHHLLSNIAGLEGDIEAVISQYEKSLSFAGEDKDFKYDYATALSNSGLVNLALPQWEQLIVSNPNDRKIAIKLANNYVWSCQFEKANKLIEKTFTFDEIRQNEELNSVFYCSKVYAEILDKAGLHEDKASELRKLAFSIIEKNNLYFSCCEIVVVDGCIFFQIYIDTSIEEAAQIDFNLSYLFAEQLENMHDDVIIFEYKSVETLKS